MDVEGKLSFALIGDGSLLVRCGERLLERSLAIPAVVSDDELVMRWAAERHLRSIPYGSLVEGLSAAGPFDYLLSIGNLSMTPAEALRLPRRMGINFHDGPLPRYAGLNVTAWALLAGERTHGVTWHVMEAAADTGAILAQSVFDILETDTALTLNARCFAAGFESFCGLVDVLESGSIQPRVQDLEHRKYFRAAKRPDGNGVLDFSAGAESVARTVRALDFGHYANPLAVAKCRTDGGVFTVVEAAVLDSTSDTAPGTVLSASEDTVRVSTADRDVLFTISSRDGKARPPLRPGTIFRTAPRANDVAERIAPHEREWAKSLRDWKPLPVPEVLVSEQENDDSVGQAPSTVALSPFNGDAYRLAAVAALFLGRRAGLFEFDPWLSHPTLSEETAGMEDLFSNVVPVGLRVEPDATLEDAVVCARDSFDAAVRARTFPLDLVQRVPVLRERGDPPRNVLFYLASAAPPADDFALAVGVDPQGEFVTWTSPSGALKVPALRTLAEEFETFLGAAASTPDAPWMTLPILPPSVMDVVLRSWNATERTFELAPLHVSIERVCEAKPERTAVISGATRLTYGELNHRANKLARHLQANGVGVGDLVAITMPRSAELLVALLAIHKAGAAYLPLDPEYPTERLSFMLADAGARVVLAEGDLRFSPPELVRVIRPSEEAHEIGGYRGDNLGELVPSDSLAYVIYTSGSTGEPKGVMLEHRNVQNFFAGMDDLIVPDEGTWLSVTSLSFDISVLELLWTLARGFTVVVHTGGAAAMLPSPTQSAESRLGFSLFFFGRDDLASDPGHPYSLVLEAARFADNHGFEAVWTPERHFNAFGGSFPNPSVLASALAVATRNVAIRAGSCVLPLHHPIRVAEEWAVVDGLSGGRVGISFAVGWQPEDFVLNPGNFATARESMAEGIESVRRLWRGETLEFTGPTGQPVSVQTHPRPTQAELPFWLTSAGSESTFREAGELGANVLTHLLGQSLADVERLVQVYRDARRAAGHEGPGQVTLMLHTFVGESDEQVLTLVREPMIEYLRSSLGLIKDFAASFPAFRNRSQQVDQAGGLFSDLTATEMQDLLDHAFERYFQTSGLFGTHAKCMETLRAIRAVGVDEVACLVDFGLPSGEVLRGLERLDAVRAALDVGTGQPTSIAELIREHNVSHFQCTPSMMSILASDDVTLQALKRLRVAMVGGESFPLPLAQQLRRELPGRLVNVYGPTETTVWSTAHEVEVAGSAVPIGRPLANTRVYVLDERGEPVAPGMIGELYIGGEGVARGYLNRPELTAHRFVPDPFARQPNARMYRTGDFARFRGDGELEFLGRGDGQVKIRGHRIELGEIETAIGRQPGVRDVVAVAIHDDQGTPSLAAYCSPREGVRLDLRAIRESISHVLPQVMVPGFIVELSDLPKTPNGKVDRKALPRPETISVGPVIGEAPSGEVEEDIAGIWREALGVSTVSRSASFFDLGGNSLLLVKVHRRLCETRQTHLSLADMFQFPTIASLAAHLSAGPAVSVGAGAARAEARRLASARRREPSPAGTPGR